MGPEMKLFCSIALILGICFEGVAADKKIDWSECKKEFSKSCSKIKDDHEKHECLEKLPKDKISKTCKEFNSSLEGKFSGKHDKGHVH